MNLYHYTDQEGFIGIIQKKTLWATKIQYLNDSNEFKLASSIAKEVLANKEALATTENEKHRIKRLSATISNIENINICVSSLTEAGDLLSQWRGYASTAGGYSIGFYKDAIENIASNSNFSLVKCIYERTEQYALIESLVDETLSKFKTYIEPSNAPNFPSNSSEYFCKGLAEMSPIIKDQNFKEESEWRLISKGGLHFKDLDFRSGKSMLTPYYKVDLGDIFETCISEVIVGHTPHINLAINSTESFIGQYCHSVKVRASSIPFRNW